jgi:hypothetical protein
MEATEKARLIQANSQKAIKFKSNTELNRFLCFYIILWWSCQNLQKMVVLQEFLNVFWSLHTHFNDSLEIYCKNCNSTLHLHITYSVGICPPVTMHIF